MQVSKSIVMISLAAAVMAFPTAQANVISGELWHVPDSVAQNAIPANVPATTADVVFDVNSPLNFTNPTSVAAFLNSGGAFNIVENTAGTLASAMSNSVVSTIVDFTGFVTVTNGQQFTVTHDDGLTLIIGGLDLGFAPGPTGPVQSTHTYTGPSGTFAFQPVYGECCSGAAVLQVDLPFSNTPTVPEPLSVALPGIGLVALGAVRARRTRR